jgi:hypothetical protein
MSEGQINVTIGRTDQLFEGIAIQVNETNREILEEFLKKHPKNLSYCVTTNQKPSELLRTLQVDGFLIDEIEDHDTDANFIVKKNNGKSKEDENEEYSNSDGNINDVLIRLNQEARKTFF